MEVYFFFDLINLCIICFSNFFFVSLLFPKCKTPADLETQFSDAITSRNWNEAFNHLLSLMTSYSDDCSENLFRLIHRLSQNRSLPDLLYAFMKEENVSDSGFQLSILATLCESSTVSRRIFHLLLEYPKAYGEFYCRLLSISISERLSDSKVNIVKKANSSSDAVSLLKTPFSCAYYATSILSRMIHYHIMHVDEELAHADEKTSGKILSSWETERDIFWLHHLPKWSTVLTEEASIFIKSFSKSRMEGKLIIRHIETITTPATAMILLLFGLPKAKPSLVLNNESLQMLLKSSTPISNSLLLLLVPESTEMTTTTTNITTNTTTKENHCRPIPQAIVDEFPSTVSGVPEWLYRTSDSIYQQTWRFLMMFTIFTLWLLYKCEKVQNFPQAIFRDARTALALLVVRIYVINWLDPTFEHCSLMESPILYGYFTQNQKRYKAIKTLFTKEDIDIQRSISLVPSNTSMKILQDIMLEQSHDLLVACLTSSVYTCQNPTCPDTKSLLQFFNAEIKAEQLPKPLEQYNMCKMTCSKVFLRRQQEKFSPDSAFIRRLEHSMLERCSSCRLVHYCCRQCQKIDWINHKKSCKAAHEAAIEFETTLQKHY